MSPVRSMGPADAPAASPSAGVPNVTVRGRNRRDPELLQLDEASLNPNRHYRWVRCRSDEHLQSVTKHKVRGYEIEAKNGEGAVRTVQQTDDRPDGVIAIGDLVLMSCPIELHEERVRERKARTEGFLASTSATTKQMAAEKGIKVIEDDG